MADFRNMTDADIEAAFRSLAVRCQTVDNPVEAFKAAAKEEFNCQYTVAITFSKPYLGMRMHMGMVHSPHTHETIHF